MSSTKRGLGRGLDALLGTSAKARLRPEETYTENETQPNIHSPLQQLAITQLVTGINQPRKEIEPEALEELADSIRSQGIIQPIVVRHLKENTYEIIAGERRFRAAKLAELAHVPCLVKVLDDKEASAIALIENIQREDLNAMEEAQALERLIEDFSLTHQELAQVLGKSRAAISNALRLNSLAPSVKKMLFARQLEMGHARALLALNIEKQAEVAQIAIDKKYTVRQTELLVKKMLSQDSAKEEPSPPSPPSPFAELQTRLSDKLGTSVTLSQKTSGKGKLVISFEKKEKLEQILAIFDESIKN